MSKTLKGVSCSFRKMQPDDLEFVLKIEQASNDFPWNKNKFEECLNSVQEHCFYDCFLCFRQNEILGYAIVISVSTENSILNICIKPSRQGQGFGRALLDYLIVKARKDKIINIFLEVRASNKKAIKLYESFYFREVAKRKDYYPIDSGRETALIYCLDLP